MAKKVKFTEILLILALIIILIIFSSKVWNFKFEDAFIIFRYAKNIGDGYGFVWNPGQNPILGSTTFLWPIILGFFGKINMSIIDSAKFLNIILALLTLFCIYFSSRNIFKNSKFTSFLVSFPFIIAIIVHIGTGMETVLFSLFLTLTFITGYKFINANNRDKKLEVLVPLLCLILVLIRPEGLIFSLVLLITLLVYKKSFAKKTDKNTDKNINKSFLLKILFLFIIPTLLFYIWNKVYFGYFLPNPFYLKKSVQIISLYSVKNMYEFFAFCIIPYLMMIFLWLINTKKEERIKIFAISLPVILFIIAHLTIIPSMNIGFRYQIPLFPIFLILASKPIEEYIIKKLRNRDKFRNKDKKSLFDNFILKILILIAILILLFWPLYILISSNVLNSNTKDDLQIVGESLNKFSSKFSGKDYTMVVTEAGLLPYYSELKVIDAWGLNDAYITHNELNEEYLEKNSPEIIQFHAYTKDGNIIKAYTKESSESYYTWFMQEWNDMVKKLYVYAEKNNYTLACIITIPGEGSGYHWYFIKKNFEDSDAIINTFKDLGICQ